VLKTEYTALHQQNDKTIVELYPVLVYRYFVVTVSHCSFAARVSYCVNVNRDQMKDNGLLQSVTFKEVTTGKITKAAEKAQKKK
jgi:hypothetical protein